MDIRIVKKSDSKELVEYTNKVSGESNFLTFGEGEFNTTIEEEDSFIDSILKQGNALFIIAEVEGKIVGTLNFGGGRRLRTAHAGEFGVSVLKEYWGQGIGTELIKYLIDWCKKSGVIRKVNLRVRSDNNSAIHVYKKLGFNDEGVITRDFLINDKFYDSIFMGLIID